MEEELKMRFDYIIVQAGGKGTRLEHLTANKPKAIVPVENLPMLFHLFRKFPDKKFIIIADYKKDVLRAYLECFANVKYQVVDADGTGTCGGVKKALELLPDGEPFMLIWSDLILSDDFQLPKSNIISEYPRPFLAVGSMKENLSKNEARNMALRDYSYLRTRVA